MTLLHFPVSLSLRPISSSFHPKPLLLNLPARDRVIDFGKHKGKMLGTLPSKYLIWVSKNLRARDFQDWAELADEVLRDPVYRDRLEWESAERILNGDGGGPMGSQSDSPVSELLEISDRFGWDNEDKAGWARVDFSLLGTSKGGRIPRVLDRDPEIGEKVFLGKDWRLRNERKDGILGGDTRVSNRKVGILRNGERFRIEAEEEEVVVRGKREERRERRRIKRGEQMEMLRREVGVGEGDGRSDGGLRKNRGLGNAQTVNPFPGRGALLDKISRQGD